MDEFFFEECIGAEVEVQLVEYMYVMSILQADASAILSHSPYSSSPAMVKAEIKLSEDTEAARFACGAKSLAASSAARFIMWCCV